MTTPGSRACRSAASCASCRTTPASLAPATRRSTRCAAKPSSGGFRASTAGERHLNLADPLPRHVPHAQLAVDRVVRLRRRQDQAVAVELEVALLRAAGEALIPRD